MQLETPPQITREVYAMMQKMVQSRLGHKASRADVDDVVQDLATEMFRSYLPKLSTEKHSLKSFVAMFVWTRSFRCFKKLHGRCEPIPDGWDQEDDRWTAEAAQDIKNERDRLRRLTHAMSSAPLSDNDRFVLNEFLNDRTLIDIAAELGVNRSQTTRSLQRARRLIAVYME